MENGEGRYITFKARYSFDLIIGLFEEELPEDGTVKLDGSGCYGICFGGWDNTKCGLFREGQTLDKTVEYDKCINNQEFKEFTIWINGKNIQVSNGGTPGENVFMEWDAEEDDFFDKFENEKVAILNRHAGKKTAEWIFNA
jgi:hypothetical protein